MCATVIAPIPRLSEFMECHSNPILMFGYGIGGNLFRIGWGSYAVCARKTCHIHGENVIPDHFFYRHSAGDVPVRSLDV